MMNDRERCFPNTLPDYDPMEEQEEESLERARVLTGLEYTSEGVGVNLTGVSGRLHFSSSEELLSAAVSLKEQVVDATWTRLKPNARDPFLYTGALGTAFLCLRSYETTKRREDLDLCLEITEACARSARREEVTYTFLCGHAGILALGAAAAKLAGDQLRMEAFLHDFREMTQSSELTSSRSHVPDELLYGRTGFLYACLFARCYLGNNAIPDALTKEVVQNIIRRGRSRHFENTLMYSWHGTRYFGAAHGLAGICHILMHFPLDASEASDVESTLKFLLSQRLPGGNYPSSFEKKMRDRLVHWCHGAPGTALALCTAAQTFAQQGSGSGFEMAAIDAGEVVWRRGLLRRLGLCHGVSGNAYVFLALFRLTGGEKHLHRARAFATFMKRNWRQLVESNDMHGGDRPWSLFEGCAGLACMWLDVASPESSYFPGFELPGETHPT